MEAGVDEMEYADLRERIRRFIRLKLVTNTVLLLGAVAGYLVRPGLDLLVVLAILGADTVFIWPYWLLTRRERGQAATYLSLSLSALALAATIHLAGGFGSALAAIYTLLVLAGGLITGAEAAPLIVACFCTAIYLSLAGLEYFGLVSDYRAIFPDTLFAASALGGTLASIWGTALVSRVLLHTVRAVTADLRRAALQERKRAAENARLLAERRETLAQQNKLLETVRELSAPIVPLMEGIVALPLVGHMDKERAHRILDKLLDEVARRRPRTVLLDLTGMAGLDQVAVEHLAQMAQGVRLLGAKVLLVGVRSDLAETMADLGLDAGQVSTQRDMQSAIAHLLAQSEQKKTLTQWGLVREA
ncbi:MAG: hypothetical protein B6I34_00655 [Anaerolineaceae bacterium 4572_32.1]|nr:MAG: hypothetical protein B6I34_00655 [Anaerolineaceae bacterium 4572_32.1]